MENVKVELKKFCGRHVFERCTTSNPFTIAAILKDYIFVKAIAREDGTVISFLYKHNRYENETLVMKYVY